MITTRFYLDARAVTPGQPAPLRLVITKKSVRSYIPLSVSLLPSQWDAHRQMVVAHPQKASINAFIQSQKLSVDSIIFRLAESGEIVGMSSLLVRNRVMDELYPPEVDTQSASPYLCFQSYIESKEGRTREIYKTTLNKILAYCPDFPKLDFDDITLKWLEKFDKFMATTAPSPNARSIHMRNLRAVFNRAVDEELTTHYPFRRFKIKTEETRKRAMSLAELRKVINSDLPQWMEPYRDMWLLSFCLIGINIADLCFLREIDPDGRVQYRRAKTHRLYSIKVEPEALAIIERYRGKGQLLYMMDTHKDYRKWYNQLCRGLKAIREYLNGIDDGVKVRELTSYNARHSWATVASDLDVPDAVISCALGHGPANPTTAIYIDRNRKKVDDANRRVLDWVLYGKK